jgi:hypothetical protein
LSIQVAAAIADIADIAAIADIDYWHVAGLAKIERVM